MAQGQNHEACLEFVADVQRLFEDFQASFKILLAKHCANGLNHVPPNYQTVKAINDESVNQTARRSQYVSCPECTLSFNRRNNLERHWLKHVQCEEPCLFCGLETSNLHTCIVHFDKCKEKARYMPASDQMIAALQRRAKLKRDASIKLDERLVQHGNGRTRRRKTVGLELQVQEREGSGITVQSPITNFSTANSPSIADGEEPSVLPRHSSFSNYQRYNTTKQLTAAIERSVEEPSDTMSNMREPTRTDGNIGTAISQQPASATSCTEGQSVNPAIPEQPAFASSYTIDQSTSPAIPEQPAFARSYTIDQSIVSVFPEPPAFAASYMTDEPVTLTVPSTGSFSSSYNLAHPQTQFDCPADTSANLTHNIYGVLGDNQHRPMDSG